MPNTTPLLHKSITLLVASLCLAFAIFTSGCATPAQTAGLAAGVTALGGQAPTHELQQTYYLGIFDPQEQLPPAFYRVTVHGQSSVLSFMRFASGWVPADAVDSLASRVEMDLETGKITLHRETDDKLAAALSAGRRQILFGPEGFRESPRDHRLVIVMGSSAEKYFDQLSGTLREAQFGASLQDLLLNLREASLEKAKLEKMQSQFKD